MSLPTHFLPTPHIVCIPYPAYTPIAYAHTQGIDHVGIGCDFDGGGGIEGVFDASEVMNITIELVRRGYSEEEIGKIWSGNVLRVFREVQALAEQKA